MAADRDMGGEMGGYDYKFVKPYPDRLACTICQLPCREAQLSSCCGHTFCESCMRRAQTSPTVGKACPVCRSEKFGGSPQLEADREIKALRVYCVNENEGCGWIGELSTLLEHCDKPTQKCLKCDNCKEVIHYTNLTSHFATDCPCYCQYCKITAEREIISSVHKEKCHKFLLTCPNNCSQDKIPRDAMDDHKLECSLEIIQCSHCKAKITRKSKEKHNDENKIEHLQLLCGEKFKGVFNELQRIAADVNDNKQEVVQFIQALSKNSNNGRNNGDLLNQPALVIRSKFVLAVLCVVVAILMMTLQLSYAQSSIISGLQQQILQEDTDLTLTETDNGLDRQNVTYKNLLTQAKIRISELENDTKACKIRLQQAKALQTKLENDFQSLKSMRHKQKTNVTDKPTEKSIQGESKELQTELNKLNYLWSLSVNVYKSCEHLYDYMDNGITWAEIIFLCNEMSLRGNQVAPVIVMMTNYTDNTKNKTQWYSSPFFAFEEGCKVQIRVDAAVYGDGEGITHDHVFVYLMLVKGPHDDKLNVEQKIPMKGIFTIELLNQLNDSTHRSSEVVFTCNSVACTFETAARYSAKAQLAPHETICYQITSDYLQNDSLYFRVSYEDTRYDYYYYYYFTRYIATPVVVTTITYVLFTLDNAHKNSDIDFRKILIKMIVVIMVDACLVTGSLIMGNNILGRMSVSVVAALTIIVTVRVWVKCRRNDPFRISYRKQKVRRNKPVIICWFIGLVASVLTNMYVVHVMGYEDYLTFVN